MNDLQTYLKENIANMENVYGFCREAINDGVYRVTRDPRYKKYPEIFKPDHIKLMMSRYVTLVELDNRFGASEKELQNREFVNAILNEKFSSVMDVEDIALGMLDHVNKILLALATNRKVGDLKDNSKLIERSAILIAAGSLRVRDLTKGFEQAEEGVLKLKTGN